MAEAERTGGANPHLSMCRVVGVDQALVQLNDAPANIYEKAFAIYGAFFCNDDGGGGGGDGSGDGGGDGGGDNGGGGGGFAGSLSV
jgi:hypothetical protein